MVSIKLWATFQHQLLKNKRLQSNKKGHIEPGPGKNIVKEGQIISPTNNKMELQALFYTTEKSYHFLEFLSLPILVVTESSFFFQCERRLIRSPPIWFNLYTLPNISMSMGVKSTIEVPLVKYRDLDWWLTPLCKTQVEQWIDAVQKQSL